MDTDAGCIEGYTRHTLYPIQKRVTVLRKDTMKAQPRKSIFGEKTGEEPRAPVNVLQKVNLEGVSRYNKAQSCVGKVFWMVLVVLFLALLIRGVYKNIYDYLYSPIATTYTINTPQELDFPDVYICMGNAFSRSYLRKHPGILADQSVFDSLVTAKRRKRSIDTFEEENDDLSIEHLDDNIKLFERFRDDEDPESDPSKRFPRATASDSKNGSSAGRHPTELYDIVNEAGFTIPSTFLSCTFHGRRHTHLDCSHVIKGIIDPNYYKCFLVDVPDYYKQDRAHEGLSLIINSQVSDYPVGVNDTKANAPTGLYISVADRYDPTNWYKTVVRPGYFTKIDLAATHVKLINLERGSLIQPCLEDGTELYRVFNTSYSRTACQMDCLLYTYYQTCRCILMMDKGILRDEILQNASFCSFNQSQTCVKGLVINNKTKMDEVDECRKHCITRCDSIRYEMRASRASLTSAVRDDLIQNQKMNMSAIPTKDLIRLDIAFSRMEFAELIQSEAKTIAIMIADIGGTMNFWLGASLIALIEIITMLLGTTCYLCLRKTR